MPSTAACVASRYGGCSPLTTGQQSLVCFSHTSIEKERSLPASILFERLTRDLEGLRAQGDDFPQTAQAYVGNWLRDGYLERRFPPGATEEEYELSTATVEAIRFVSAIAEPRSAATESRLSLVIQALVGLAEDTDSDKPRRIDRLMAEQARIDTLSLIITGRAHLMLSCNTGMLYNYLLCM